jgi:hypothetical protein
MHTSTNHFSLHERISPVCRKHLASDILHLHENRIMYTLILPLYTISDSEYMEFNLPFVRSSSDSLDHHAHDNIRTIPPPLLPHIQFPFTSLIHIPPHLSVLDHQAGTAFTSPLTLSEMYPRANTPFTSSQHLPPSTLPIRRKSQSLLLTST